MRGDRAYLNCAVDRGVNTIKFCVMQNLDEAWEQGFLSQRVKIHCVTIENFTLDTHAVSHLSKLVYRRLRQ